MSLTRQGCVNTVTGLEDEFRREPLLYIFCSIVMFGAAVFAVAAVVSPQTFYTMLGRMSDVVFTDHFCSIVYSLDHPYTSAYNVIYPALINDVYAVLGHVCVNTLDYHTGNLELDMYRSEVPMLLCVFFMVAGAALMLVSSLRLTGDRFTSSRRDLLFLALIFTSPVFVAFQAGNCIFYSVFFVILFLAGYRSENRWIRYLSYLALSIATCIKMIPVILCALILREHRFREFLVFVFMAAVLFVVPFVFTDGTPLDVVRNIFELPASTGGSTTNISKLGLLLSDATGVTLFRTLGTVLSYAVMLLAFLLVAVDRSTSHWRIVLLLCCVMVVGPGVGTRYLFMNLFPAIMLFLLCERNITRENVIVTVCLAVSVMMLPSDYVIISTLCVIILLVIMMGESISNTFASLRRHEDTI